MQREKGAYTQNDSQGGSKRRCVLLANVTVPTPERGLGAKADVYDCLISPPAVREAQARRVYVLLLFYIFLVISVRSIFSTSPGPTFKKFAGYDW